MTGSEVVRTRVVASGLLACLACALFPPVDRVVEAVVGAEPVRTFVGHRFILWLVGSASGSTQHVISFPRFTAYWLVCLAVSAAVLWALRGSVAWGPAVSDSLGVGVVSLACTLLAWSGALEHAAVLGSTGAYLAYFIWPVVCLILTAVNCGAAIRDWQAGLTVQAALGGLASAYSVIFTAQQFRGWE